MNWKTGVPALSPEAQVAWVERQADEFDQGFRILLWWVLGDGLNERGKEKWLAMRLQEGMGPQEIARDAIKSTEPMVAT